MAMDFLLKKTKTKFQVSASPDRINVNMVKQFKVPHALTTRIAWMFL